jgi:hypothetical protein
MISFVDSITVLQRRDWLRGMLLYKWEKKIHNRGRRKSEEETEPGRKHRRKTRRGETQKQGTHRRRQGKKNEQQ